MFRHMVLFAWTQDATDEQKRQVSEQLGTLPGQIPEIKNYWFGPDAGITEGAWDYGIVADFDDAESWVRYRDNEVHQAIIKQYIAPLIAQRAALQQKF